MLLMARSISCRLLSCNMAMAELATSALMPFIAGLTRLPDLENEFILNTSATACGGSPGNLGTAARLGTSLGGEA